MRIRTCNYVILKNDLLSSTGFEEPHLKCKRIQDVGELFFSNFYFKVIDRQQVEYGMVVNDSSFIA